MKTLLTTFVLCVLIHTSLRADDEVPLQRMREVYEEVQTPYKFGVVIRGEDGKPVDCPSVFRHGERWYMVYICYYCAVGSQGRVIALATSRDVRASDTGK